MKTLITQIIIIIAGFSCYAQQNVLLQGSIKHFDQGEVLIAFYDNMLSRQQKEYKTQADEEGNFRLEIQLEQAIGGSAHFKNRTIGVYLIPGDTLNIRFDYLNFNKTVSFEGDAANEMGYFSRFWGKFLSDSAQQELWKSIERNDYQKHQDFLLNTLAAKEAFLKSYHEKNELSMAFQNREINKYRYHFARDSYGFSNYYINVFNSDTSGTLPPLPISYFQFLEKVNINNEGALLQRSYVDFLTLFLINKHQQLVQEVEKETIQEEKKSNGLLPLIETAKILYSGKVKDFVIADLIRGMIDNGAFEVAKAEYDMYMAGDGNPLYKEILRNRKKSYFKLATGQAAPNFSLPDLSGHRSSLHDFKGKVVYLDFWASWCKPCLAQVPASKELKKEFSGVPDVVFINISIDDVAENWRNAVDEYKIEGINLHADNENIINEYAIRNVPKYILLNRDGTVAMVDAPPPTEKNLVLKAIHESLNRKNKPTSP